MAARMGEAGTHRASLELSSHGSDALLFFAVLVLLLADAGSRRKFTRSGKDDRIVRGVCRIAGSVGFPPKLNRLNANVVVEPDRSPSGEIAFDSRAKSGKSHHSVRYENGNVQPPQTWESLLTIRQDRIFRGNPRL